MHSKLFCFFFYSHICMQQISIFIAATNMHWKFVNIICVTMNSDVYDQLFNLEADRQEILASALGDRRCQ